MIHTLFATRNNHQEFHIRVYRHPVKNAEFCHFCYDCKIRIPTVKMIDKLNQDTYITIDDWHIHIDYDPDVKGEYAHILTIEDQKKNHLSIGLFNNCPTLSDVYGLCVQNKFKIRDFSTDEIIILMIDGSITIQDRFEFRYNKLKVIENLNKASA